MSNPSKPPAAAELDPAAEGLPVSAESTLGLSVRDQQFVARVAHDMRTPLTALRGIHFLLEKRVAEMTGGLQANVIRLLGMQAEAIGNLDDLIEDVLTLDRVERAEDGVGFEWTAADDLVASLVAEANAAIPSPRVRADLEPHPDWMVRINATLFGFALRNLIANGLKYSPKTSEVLVKLYRWADGWRVEVSDRGCGIPEQDQARLFAPFFRAGNVGPVTGSGLGLSIVRRVMDLHRGSIEFSSMIGVGSTFILVSPPPGAETGRAAPRASTRGAF
jgi:signal transduction histidine kinase